MYADDSIGWSLGPGILDIYNRAKKLQPLKILARETGLSPGQKIDVSQADTGIGAGMKTGDIGIGAMLLVAVGLYMLSKKK
jgi:hypothetical protein